MQWNEVHQCIPTEIARVHLAHWKLFGLLANRSRDLINSRDWQVRDRDDVLTFTSELIISMWSD